LSRAFGGIYVRFNFLARRAFFHAMHLDLHAIRESVNELERLDLPPSTAETLGRLKSESLTRCGMLSISGKRHSARRIRRSSFLQLILLRHALQRTLDIARENALLRRARTFAGTSSSRSRCH
jgi:hypothetical protein